MIFTLIFYSPAAKSFVELTRYLFTMPRVKVFLSQRICQDALEKSVKGNCCGAMKESETDKENQPYPKGEERENKYYL